MRKVEVKELDEIPKKKSGTTSEFHYFAIYFHSCDAPSPSLLRTTTPLKR